MAVARVQVSGGEPLSDEQEAKIAKADDALSAACLCVTTAGVYTHPKAHMISNLDCDDGRKRVLRAFAREILSGKCECGDVTRLGVVHRVEPGPCYEVVEVYAPVRNP